MKFKKSYILRDGEENICGVYLQLKTAYNDGIQVLLKSHKPHISYSSFYRKMKAAWDTEPIKVVSHKNIRTNRSSFTIEWWPTNEFY